jgi:hypothetical protein
MGIHIMQDGTVIRTPPTAEEKREGAVAELEAEAEALASVEYLVETNQGTYGAGEARRKVGVAEPHFADRDVYETVGGARREMGCDADRMPCRVRRCNRAALAADRKRLAELRREIRNLSR